MQKFPSPYGAWVVSAYRRRLKARRKVSVPLRGMGCISNLLTVFTRLRMFPSPYGAWVVSAKPDTNRFTDDGILVDNNVVKTTMSSYRRYRRVNYSISRTKCQYLFDKKSANHHLFFRKIFVPGQGSHRNHMNSSSSISGKLTSRCVPFSVPTRSDTASAVRTIANQIR